VKIILFALFIFQSFLTYADVDLKLNEPAPLFKLKTQEGTLFDLSSRMQNKGLIPREK
jgi:hypothetical protein